MGRSIYGYKIINSGGNTLTWTTEPKQTVFDTEHEAILKLYSQNAYYDNRDNCWKDKDNHDIKYKIVRTFNGYIYDHFDWLHDKKKLENLMNKK